MRAAFTYLMLFLSITLSFVFQPSIHAQSLDDVTVDVINVDTQDFPNINVAFSVTDQYGNVIDTLKADDVLVTLDSGTGLESKLTFNKSNRGVAVAIVLDTSVAMNDQSTPFRTRLTDAQEKIHDLLLKLPDSSPLSLITFNSSSNVAFPIKADGGGIRNALRSITLDTAIPAEAPYDISNAIKLAIDELQSFDGYAKNIIVFAAGTPNADYPFGEIKDSLNAIPSQQPKVTIIGLGSAQEGQFTQYPANPESLERLAQSLDATFAPISASTIDQVGPIMAEVDARFDQAIQSSNTYSLTVNVGSIGAGQHSLNVAIGNQTVPIPFIVTENQVNAEIVLHTPPILNETAVLSVAIGFTPNPITKVQYFLDNKPIFESISAPHFGVPVDLEQLLASYDQSQQHTIFAAAIDSQQKSYRSAEKQITLSPSTNSGLNIWYFAIIFIVIVAIIIIWLLVRFIRKKGNDNLISRSGSIPVPLGGITGDYRGVTGDYEGLNGNTISNWIIEIREPHMNPRPYPLMNDSVVLIGRTHGSTKADINLDNEHISRDHAKITVKNNFCSINDQGSKFGTFIASSGTKNQRLDQNLFQLQLGDVIILGKTGIELELKEA
ncbi:FHA domain-containing protein [Herpetosiphon llansteffanensis]